MIKTPKPKCMHCNKTLVPIASARINGTYKHSEWTNRKYHKKCWKEINEIKEYEETIKRHLEETKIENSIKNNL